MSEALQQAEELRQKAIALLVAERQAIDEKLHQLGGGDGADGVPAPKKNKCSKCGEEGHTARTCPQKEAAPPANV